ncbi:MAG TPA: extracellular solute-binding protein [Candidatus Paceibacterota bacterium]|nr:extracellular solute-binding protein [Candidatus Paceibacterota bacterium]
MRSSFQTTLVIVFSIVFVIAVAVFSGIFSKKQTSTSSAPSGLVTVWGILPSDQMQQYVDDFNGQGVGYTISYTEHPAAQFANDLTNALADGKSPDIVIFSSELFSQFRDKLYTIPFTAYSERNFRDTNVDGGQVFLTKDGILGLPLLVDPIVVYYNKDLLASANFVVPPSRWSDLTKTVPIFTKRDSRGNITQSTIALGEGDNINHWRDILSTLFLQSGNQIITYDTTTGIYHAALADGASSATDTLPTVSALLFYTNFSNPTSGVYTWNRTLPSSLDMFLSGRLAFYIGRASELFTIQSKNPNLNFDVAPIFQPDNAVRATTFGSFVAAGIMKNAPNFNAAYAFSTVLSSSGSIDSLSKALSLPPPRRDLLQVQQNNPYISVFFKAALSAFAWPDPNPTTTEQIFRAMISDVVSGRADPNTAIYEATKDLQTSIK